MKHRKVFENLEVRQYLAGVTLLDPAWNGGLTGWLDHTEAAITAELGGPQNVPEYVLTLAPNSGGTLEVTGATHVAGTATPQSNNPGQILVTIDYTSVSTNPGYPASEVGSLVANFMENTPVDGVTWASLPIHLISTSRGTAIEDGVAEALDQSGVWVDQETYLDPHPITQAPFNDITTTVFDNVEFSDTYWRTSGEDTLTDPAGHPVGGSYNLELPWVQADFSGFALAHLAPPAYYIGTIDPSMIGGSDGDGPIHTDWYGDGSASESAPAPDQTGFLYTNIVGGARPTSGLWAASGGSGFRTSVAHAGTQWPNVSDVTPTSTTAASYSSLPVNFIQEDQGSSQTITLYLDTNQNPFDGTGIKIGTASNLAQSTTIQNGTIDASLNGVAAGTYYVCAEATDASGQVRYNYSTEQVTVTAPPSAIVVSSAAHSNPSTITGTSSHLIVGALDVAGDAMSYKWTFTHLPAGAKTPSISRNGTSAGASAPVTFYKQGGYSFTCTITDTAGNSTTSSGVLEVVSTATKLKVSPVGATIRIGKTRRFSTTVINQFGHTMDPPAGAAYSIIRGPATINAQGVFSAGNTAGTALIRVEEDGIIENLDALVVN